MLGLMLPVKVLTLRIMIMIDSHKKAVIEAAIQGLIDGGMYPEEAKLYANLLETLYTAGYNEAIRNA